MNKYDILSFSLLSTVLLTPATSTAYNLGEIQVQSYLGQPFRATIPIQTSMGKEIDSDCLKLSPPAIEKNMIYLRRATLSLARHGDSSQLLISGHFPLEEPYLRVVIDLGCMDNGHLIREYTVLIDPPAYTYLPALANPHAENGQPTSKILTVTHTEASDTKSVPVFKKKSRQAFQKARPINSTKNNKDQLKVLSGTGERPAQPGMSEKDRLRQHEVELMKELDDKTAKYLEMQAQLGKLEGKLAEMQKTLERQNQLLAAMQPAPKPENKTSLSLKNEYWVAGPFILIVGFAYFLARRLRKQTLENWTSTINGQTNGNSNIQPDKPRLGA